jgi:hypothetical protein
VLTPKEVNSLVFPLCNKCCSSHCTPCVFFFFHPSVYFSSVMTARHFPLHGLFVFSAFRMTTFPPRLETTLNYATPREDHAEYVVALSAGGWNSFTMNNFALSSLLLHRYCPDGETLRSLQLSSNIYLLLCRCCLLKNAVPAEA